MTFDPATYGLMSHYPPDVQQRIRRTILEDWQVAQVKLPTYMKLVTRYIAPSGVPEDWLSKLSHQTMAKMLKFESTPRHIFWACLHLYINRKYGSEIVSGVTQSAAHHLGQAITTFGTVTPIEAIENLQLAENETLAITPVDGKQYSTVSKTIDVPTPAEEDTQIQYKFEGIGFKTGSGSTSDTQTVIILRDCLTYEVTVTYHADEDLKAAQS